MSWFHQEDSTKKSFLIRDILATSKTNYRQDVFNWVLNQTANSDPNIHHHHLTFWNWTSSNQLVNQDNELKVNNHHNFVLNPIVRNWLENNSHTEKLLEDANQDSNIQPFGDSEYVEVNSIQNRLYQNLCYYAMQQQINASMFCRSTIQQDDQNNIRLLASNVDETLATSNPSKPKKRKQLKPNMNSTKTSIPIIRRSTANKSNKANIRSKNKIERNIKSENNTLTSLEMIINMSNDIIEESDGLKSNGNLGLLHQLENCRRSKLRKIRRNRTVFTELQLMGLERRFDSQKYLSTPDRTDLARALGLTQLQVKTWYQNRRMKWKKQVMQNGCPYPPTKPKGRPKKDSIPTYGLEFTNSILCPLMADAAHHHNESE